MHLVNVMVLIFGFTATELFVMMSSINMRLGSNSGAIKGVLVNGTTGEGVCQRSAERKKSFEEWNEAYHKYDFNCMVPIGGTFVATAHDLAEHAEENEAE